MNYNNNVQGPSSISGIFLITIIGALIAVWNDCGFFFIAPK